MPLMVTENLICTLLISTTYLAHPGVAYTGFYYRGGGQHGQVVLPILKCTR